MERLNPKKLLRPFYEAGLLRGDRYMKMYADFRVANEVVKQTANLLAQSRGRERLNKEYRERPMAALLETACLFSASAGATIGSVYLLSGGDVTGALFHVGLPAVIVEGVTLIFYQHLRLDPGPGKFFGLPADRNGDRLEPIKALKGLYKRQRELTSSIG